MAAMFPAIRVCRYPVRTLPARTKIVLHQWCFHSAAESLMQAVQDLGAEAGCGRFVTLVESAEEVIVSPSAASETGTAPACRPGLGHPGVERLRRLRFPGPVREIS